MHKGENRQTTCPKRARFADALKCTKRSHEYKQLGVQQGEDSMAIGLGASHFNQGEGVAVFSSFSFWLIAPVF
jgi:hypothetical protein